MPNIPSLGCQGKHVPIAASVLVPDEWFNEYQRMEEAGMKTRQEKSGWIG